MIKNDLFEMIQNNINLESAPDSYITRGHDILFRKHLIIFHKVYA